MTELNRHDGEQSGHALEPDVVVTRSEEELRIATVRRETQRARLIRYVEIDTQARTVVVRHERAASSTSRSQRTLHRRRRRQRGGRAGSGVGALRRGDVVQTRWVARERGRLATQSVIEDREISEDLRRAQIEIDDTTYGG
jgi:hypothetical protein